MLLVTRSSLARPAARGANMTAQGSCFTLLDITHTWQADGGCPVQLLLRKQSESADLEQV